ncbi:MAG: GGDEF domain-containing protein [gamma proteobacterium symbiont of Bathyaustriella thionipta]|nr:GGDEF domain-containing protein [gamma proteobacterium symbiont of Bathyaustriella thionipta]MCU7948481.1 GGDEF domain-containing protein [gamma proteobacterium symbiont of Bathyaustriella thionipta]MCU7952705.1 GGDEF domain-containing protein [gamma proteobacterium symbiont of Bathyaustriella thionipta]MCU7957501.1 GGDEF domain-containing protein [gamma proteobacterium symbiont of Bathyaustriella thionipta]MCU7966348.1 GGDEF domain-containing protein [gamma proteobacterium symbiont of Bathy
MKAMLETRFKERKQAEKKLKAYSEQLEEQVLKRTEELTRANEHLKKLSEIDPLTQIFNRRIYENRLAHEIISAKRSQQPLSLILIDIDYFKSYNDHYGHDSGDDTLKNVALTIKETVPRETDITARIGGEEFVVLMPSTNSQGAYQVAENIRTNIKALAIKHKYSEVINIITVSIGVSTLSGILLNEIDLFKQADMALYSAKEAGRNRCKCYV